MPDEKKFRILHVTSWIPMFPYIGGFETIIREIAEEQARQGHKVFVIGKDILKTSKRLKRKVINDVTYIYIWKKARENYRTLPFIFKLYKMLITLFELFPNFLHTIRHEKINIVIFYDTYAYAPLAFLSRLFGSSAILGHIVLKKVYPKYSPMYFLLLMLLNCFSAIFTYTNNYFIPNKGIINNIAELKRYLGNRVYYIPGGINYKKYAEIKPDSYLMLQKKRGYFIILCARRMVVEKGVHILLEAIPKVIEKYKKTIFVFAGDGELKKTLIDRAKELKIENNVIFTGQIPHPSIMGYFKASDLTVVPSLSEENFGMVFLEAYATKTPIISTTFGGIPDVVENNKSGLLVSPGRYDELADAIITLLESPDERSRLAKCGYELVKTKYDLSKVTRNIIDICTSTAYKI